MMTVEFDEAAYLANQVEEARQRAVLASADAEQAKLDAQAAEYAARESANKGAGIILQANQAVLDAQTAAAQAQAPTDEMVADLAMNPASLTRDGIDKATGEKITEDGSATQSAGDARWLKRDGADIAIASEIERTGSEIQASGDARWVTNDGADTLVASEIERTGSETQTAGDARWITNEGADTTISALLNTSGSAVQLAADSRYNRRGEDRVLVTDFGAVGDGATNNDAAFNAAISYAYGTFGQGGKTVVFPAGDYVTYQRINIKGNLQYEAYGATFRKPNVGAGYAVFYTRSNGAKGYGSGDSNIVWRGGTFKGKFATDNMICPFALHHTDNFEAYDFTCIETQGIGHGFDMLGCSNIRLHDFKVFGFKNNSTAGYQKSEFIQLDVSMASASSAPDTVGSYDGLMTKDVHVTRALFSSITADGVFYPAPNPIGSHAQHETRIPTDVRFDFNTIVNPMLDNDSGVFGAIHFVGVNRLYVEDNIFYYTGDSPNASTTLVGLYSTNKGVPIGTAQYEAGTSNTIGTIASPMTVQNVSIARNKVWGVKADSLRHLFVVENKSDSTDSVYAKNIVNDTNEITVGAGNWAIHAFAMTYVDGLYFKGKNKTTGPIRAVQGTNCINATIDDFELQNARADAIRFDAFDGLRIKTITTKDSAGTSLYLATGSNLELQGGFYHSLAGSRAIALNGVALFQIGSVRTKSPSGVVGVQVYSASSNGYVNSVIATGGTATAVTNSSSSVTVASSLLV